MTRLLATLILLASLCSVTVGHAATWYVSEVWSGGSTQAGTITNPITGQDGIQKAIDAASSGDTIKVGGGTYSAIDFPAYPSGGPAVDLKVQYEAFSGASSAAAVIDGTVSSTEIGVGIEGGQTGATEFVGFTVANFSGLAATGIFISYVPSDETIGASPYIGDCTIKDNCSNSLSVYGGAGMKIAQNSNPTVDSCTFEGNVIGCSGNTDAGYGGALWIYANVSINPAEEDCDTDDHPDPLIEDCVFIENEALNNSFGSGGAIAITCAKATIRGCTFEGNLAAHRGGAIYGVACDGTIVRGCTFELGNKAEKGGAIYIEGKDYEDTVYERVHLVRNTFDGNLASSGDGAGGAIYAKNKDITVSHSTFQENDAELVAAAMWLGVDRAGDGTEFSAYVVCNLFGHDNDVTGGTHEQNKCVIWAEQTDGVDKLDILFVNNTIAGNSNVRAITLANAENSSSGKLEFTCHNSILYENDTSLTDESIYDFGNHSSNLVVSYTNAEQQVFSGTGNISTDPSFISSTDFHLDDSVPSASIDTGSGALWTPASWDSNIPNKDLDGNRRIVNSRIDMGCYEDQ